MELLELLRGFYSNREIEDRCGMPARTLQPGREVPSKYHDKMVEVYEEVRGKDPIHKVEKEQVFSDRIYTLTPHRVFGTLTLDNKWDGYKLLHDRTLNKRDRFVCVETGEMYWQMPVDYGRNTLTLGQFREDGLFVADRSLPKDKQTLREGMTFRKVEVK